VPLVRQGRWLWDGALIREGLRLLNATLAAGRIDEYQLVASIAALHDEAASHASTRWAEIAKAYARLESLTGNPMVRLNRAVAVAMVEGPAAASRSWRGSSCTTPTGCTPCKREMRPIGLPSLSVAVAVVVPPWCWTSWSKAPAARSCGSAARTSANLMTRTGSRARA